MAHADWTSFNVSHDGLDRGMQTAKRPRYAVSSFPALAATKLWLNQRCADVGMAVGAIPLLAAATAPQLQQQPVLPEGTRPNLLPMKLLPRQRLTPRGTRASNQASDSTGAESYGSRGWRSVSKSIADKTALAKLPVITAVEIAPGTARRRRAYWQAMSSTQRDY